LEKGRDFLFSHINLPEGFEEKIRGLLGEEAEEFFSCLSESRNYAIRANLLKIVPAKLKELLPFLQQPVEWCNEGFYYLGVEKPAKSGFYHAGLFYIQEPSAMVPVSVAGIEPGQAVLDLCAAPGGKSTHAAGLLQGKGVLVANDISFSRSKALAKNLEACGATNAVVLCEKPDRLASRFGTFFDRILIDAPCSGEGMFRKDPDAMKSWSGHKPAQCAAMQRDILFQAQRMLKSSGRIVYSTCTFDKTENEGMIREFLSKHPNFSIKPIDAKAYGLSEGFPEAPGSARAWPHRQKGEGHFVCVLEKSQEADNTCEIEVPKPIRGIELFHEFCASYLNKSFSGRFIAHGPVLYLSPVGLPNLDGIRIARNGWHLGEFKTNRFEPSQALAMGLKREEAKLSVSFEPEGELLGRYLKGESFDVDCDDGWALACVGPYPLGWAKVQDGRMKNKLLKGWITP
jgi:NOL1/NOP2/sun family putative RNA methylase